MSSAALAVLGVSADELLFAKERDEAPTMGPGLKLQFVRTQGVSIRFRPG